MKKQTTKIFLIILLLFTAFFIMHGALADPPPGTSSLGKLDPTKVGAGGGISKDITNATEIGALAVNLIDWFAWFIALVSVVMGLYAGFLFITARGETAQLATAKKILLYAVIGIAVAVVSFSIITITKAFLP